jgi:uncharacterized membrane protein
MNWHQKYKDNRTFSEKLADNVASIMGSWRFIIIQTIIVFLWMVMNILGIMYEWDKYPFILLNLLFSTQAAYAAPIIMMSQNRQNARDRVKAEADYETNKESNFEIGEILKRLERIETEKLDKIMNKLDIQEPEQTDEDPMEAFEAASKIYFKSNEFMERLAFEEGAKWQAKQFKKQ